MKIPANSIRLFENPVMERLTHVNPITPFIFWIPVVAVLIARSYLVWGLDHSQVIGLGIAGFITWTLAEYGLHRYLFHFKSDYPPIKRFIFLLHGNHHDVPDDKTRLVMPLLASIPLGLILGFMFLPFLGFEFIEPFFAFFVIGYLFYDFTHYATHHFKPVTKYGQWIKKNHMSHHFIEKEYYWGVSTPFWDFVFGTYPSKKSKDTNSKPKPSTRSQENMLKN